MQLAAVGSMFGEAKVSDADFASARARRRVEKGAIGQNGRRLPGALAKAAAPLPWPKAPSSLRWRLGSKNFLLTIPRPDGMVSAR